ncbi:DUF6059 family protein [Streptomyces sp. SAS_260]|uniref:DUF6059 family protein n=1 Tax=Streptomyces sp. SAS_260 TaxID=3412751 RepID=UPI00403C9FB3
MYGLWWRLNHWVRCVITTVVRGLAAMGRLHVGVEECDPFPVRTVRLSAPPARHPERLRPDLPPTALERSLEHMVRGFPRSGRTRHPGARRQRGRPPSPPGGPAE